MSGIDFIADTNALLYVFKKNPCMVPYLNSKIGISVISEMELLSYPKITSEEDLFFRRMIASCKVIPLSDSMDKGFIRITELDLRLLNPADETVL